MKRSGPDATTMGSSDRNIHGRHPAVATLREVVDYLVESAGNKVGKLHFHNRPEALHGKTDSSADCTGFYDRGISDSLFSISLIKPLRYLEDATIFTHILTHQEKSFIFIKRLPVGQVNGVYRPFLGSICRCLSIF